MTTQAGSKARILAVEDDPHIRILLQHLLRAHFEVVLVSTVDEALGEASGQSFDLFLFDINLRDYCTGVELLHTLRALPAYRTTPAIACTAYAMHEDQNRLLNEGFLGYVGKPFTREALVTTVQEVLEEASRIEAGIHLLPPAAAPLEALHNVAA